MMINKEELKNVGAIFKQRRKEMNISLKEVENATSIRTSYLQAIEEADMHKLISPVYAHGFIKQYASFLNIDSDAIFRDHPELLARSETHEFSYGIGTLEMRGNPGASVKWFPNALWIFSGVLVLGLAWYFAKFLEVI